MKEEKNISKNNVNSIAIRKGKRDGTSHTYHKTIWIPKQDWQDLRRWRNTNIESTCALVFLDVYRTGSGYDCDCPWHGKKTTTNTHITIFTIKFSNSHTGCWRKSDFSLSLPQPKCDFIKLGACTLLYTHIHSLNTQCVVYVSNCVGTRSVLLKNGIKRKQTNVQRFIHPLIYWERESFLQFIRNSFSLHIFASSSSTDVIELGWGICELRMCSTLYILSTCVSTLCTIWMFAFLSVRVYCELRFRVYFTIDLKSYIVCETYTINKWTILTKLMGSFVCSRKILFIHFFVIRVICYESESLTLTKWMQLSIVCSIQWKTYTNYTGNCCLLACILYIIKI